MTHEIAVEIWHAIETTVLGELKAELVSVAIRYARLRADWWLATPEGRVQMDSGRSAAHERLIDSLNILARNMKQTRESSKWRDRLGTDRQVIGDWACHLHALLGILAR